MNDKKPMIAILVIYFGFVLAVIMGANLADKIRAKDAAYQLEIAELKTEISILNITPTPTNTPTPTPEPTATPTPTPKPTPIAVLSNQEWYDECVARGLVTPANDYDDRITAERGGYMGESGRETYYNLNMSNCVAYMRELGYDELNYPYWVRDDGAKMLGLYVMCAANWKIRPKGTIIPTSLGDAIVVDTGEFVTEFPYGVDLAVDW